MAFERLLRLTKKCPGYVVSGLRNAKRWYSNCHSRVVQKPILRHPGSFLRPVTFCHDTATPRYAASAPQTTAGTHTHTQHTKPFIQSHLHLRNNNQASVS